jgi:SAM-dependent methyltransferase
MPPRDASARTSLRSAAFKALHFYRDWFRCPVCGYHGPFRDVAPATGRRRHAQCAGCGALERHRLQVLVARKVLEGRPTRAQRMLHVAPEALFTELFRSRFGAYETADLAMPGVDHRVDLQALPFADASYDVVYASHVLEHVPDDRRAIAEIRRVLRPGGIAVLPVPLVSPATVEYPAPNPHETQHVRAPGPDYFARFVPPFARVDLYASGDFPAEHQLWVYEDRSGYPSERSPWRVPMAGARHADVVPVCHA